MQTTLFSLERFLKKLADDQYSSITKGSIYHILYIQPFTTIVDWAEIWRLMEVSTMFYICRNCVFTWYDSTSLWCYATWDKILWPSHNALLSMGYFVQVVMWVISDKAYAKRKIGMTSDKRRCLSSPTMTCIKYLIGSNALWDGYSIFSDSR